MGQFIVTPEWVGTFETNQHVLIQNGWDEVQKNLLWDRYMETRPSTTLKEIYFWLLETAAIRDEDGAQKFFDGMAALSQTITNKDSGAGLKLTRNEIEDNMMASGQPALDYAAAWASEIGGAAAYWPQKKLFELIAAGEGTTLGTAYDGKPFFATDHPVNPYDDAAGDYANLITTTCAIDASVSLEVAATNFASVIARIRGFRQPNGTPRMLRPVGVLAGPLLEKRSREVTEAKFYGQDGSTENVITRYGTTVEIADEMTSSTEYIVLCKPVTSGGAPFIFQDRMPYVMSTYTPDTQAILQLRKEYMWTFDGRNVPTYGHPYLAVKCKP